MTREMLTAGRGRGRGRSGKGDEEALAQRLQQASDAQLQQLAQYRRPKWQTITLRALAVEDDEDVEGDDDSDGDAEEEGEEGEEEDAKEKAEEVANDDGQARDEGAGVGVNQRKVRESVVVMQQPLEMLEGASLADVRKLITTFCAAKIPSRFVFAALHRRLREGLMDDETDEGDVVVENALDEDGVLVVLIPSQSSRTFAHGNPFSTTRVPASTALSTSPRSHAQANVLPAFSASRILFGDVSAAVNVFIRRSDGVTLELSFFCDRSGAKIEDLPTAELTMQLVPKVLSQRVGMTESMASILLSSPRGQSKIIKKLLGKLHLSVVDGAESGGEEELRWQWTAQNVVADKDLHVNRRTRAAPQTEEPAPRTADISEQDDMTLSTPSATKIDEPTEPPDIGDVEHEEQANLTDSIPLPSIGDSTQPALAPAIKPLVKRKDEAKPQPCEEVRSKPAGTPPEKKKPEQVQATKPLLRKSSVDVNAAQVRSCLEIGATRIGDDVPSCFSLQMVFVELMLRDFASSSLPVFVSEVRPALREVYRSTSQTSTPEIVVKSIDLLWAGLSVAFWESKLDQIVAHFHKETSALVSDLRSKLTKTNFEVLEASPLPVLPGHVVAMLRALAVLAGEQQVDEKSIETIIRDLGLNNTTSKRRVKSFKALLKKKTGVHALSPSSTSLLSTYVAEADLTRSMTPEDQCNLSSLRSLLTAVMDTFQFDLKTYARRYVAAGENVTILRSGIWTLITRKERNGNMFVSESTKNVESLTTSISTWASEQALVPDQMKRLVYLLQQQLADPVRWYKAQRDCEVLASCPRPVRLRWYIEPSTSWCEHRSERYMLVGEADFMFEFVYLTHEESPHPDQSTLVRRALSSWFDSADATVEGTTVLSPESEHTKVAFGVNYRYAGHPTVTNGIPDLKSLLACTYLNSLVVGCSHGAPGCSNAVMLRFYVQENFAQQNSRSVTVFLNNVVEENEMQKKIIEHGALALLRMLALRVQRKREPVISLDECVHLGDSQAHMALRAALRVAGHHAPLVLSPSVAHLALDLIVRRHIDIVYGCDYLRSLQVFVEEASTSRLCEFLNQRFERSEDPRLLDPEADVYDVLWLLASSQAGFAEKWRYLAEQIVSRVFLLRGIQDDRRVFKYSSLVGDDMFHLSRDDGGSVRAIGFDSSNEDILAYFDRIPRVVQEALHDSTSRIPVSSRFGAAVNCTPTQKIVAITEELLERFFAVLRTEAGLLRLFMREEVVKLIEDILEERGHSSSMALLAVDHVAFVAVVCERNEEVQRMVCDLRLVDRLVGVAWRVESEVVGSKLIDALSNFQSLACLRKQVVQSLHRISRPPASYREFSLMGQILPSSNNTGDRDEYVRRVRRFNSLARSQFYAAHECPCGGQKNKRRVVSTDAEVELVSRTATKFVSAVIGRAVVLTIAGRSQEERLSASQRLLSAAIRFRKAAKIQHRVLRWLYVSKRLLTRPRPTTRGIRSCGICKRTSSFVEGVVRYLDAIELAEPRQTTQMQGETTKALQCFEIFVSDHDLCQVLVSEFRLHRTLLVLVSSKSQAVRSLALKVLAELCWRSPIAFDFTKSRLMKPIWENFAALLKKNESRYCSWIERTLNMAVNKSRVTSSLLITATTAFKDTHRVIKEDGDCERDPDIDSAASMMMVLSYASEDFDVMLRIVRLTSGSVNQWVDESEPYTHVKMLLVIQNTLILAPSLSALSDMALKCIQDFRLMLNAAYVNDRLAKTLIFGIMWTMCTNANIRRQVAAQYPEVLGEVIKWMEATISISRVPDPSLLPVLLNGVGLVATLSVDCALQSVTPHIIRLLYQLYSSLDAATSGVNVDHNLVGTKSKSAVGDAAGRRYPFCSVQSSWATQLVRFKLLPEIGSLRCSSTWEQVAHGVKDQVFRFFAIVTSSQTYDDATSLAALQCYVDALESQISRGGCSADFALKTLSHVFRCATTPLAIDSSSKRPAMTEEQVSTIVDVLGATIQRNADLRRSGVQASNGFSAKKTIRLVIMALWGLQVTSGRAQSLSHSLTNELVDLLRGSKDDTKLSIAILGLLVKMYRVHAHVEGETRAAASSISDRNQRKVMEVVMREVPTIMELLRPHSSTDDSSKIVHRTKLWSPLLLDKASTTSAAQYDHNLEVVKSVRWPIEVLNLLCESIFIENITPEQDYYDVILSILRQLDTKTMRSADVQGRDEVVLAIARILRVFCRRTTLTPAQADHCIRALFESDSMMTYASDLAGICHTTVRQTRSVDALICRPERKILVASLCFISSGKLRLDVLSKCLDMVSAFITAMGEDACMKQLMQYEHDHGSSASSALFGHVVKIFQGAIKEEIEWVVCRKGLKLLQELITWDSFLNRVVRGKKTEEEGDLKKAAASHLESVSLQRSRTHLFDETTRGMVRIALLLVHFKYWLGDVSSSFFDEVLKASAYASQIIVSMLQDFHDNSKNSAILLAQVADAIVHNNQHKLLPSPTMKESMEALVYIFSTTFKDARNSLCSSFLSRETCEVIYLSALDGLLNISRHHRARHSVQMTDFFIQNYRNPIFDETRPDVLGRLLRLYRRCCCNAFVYRLIRLGKTTLWNLSDEDDDQSFYKRLGTSFVKFGSAEDEARFDIALFLAHQHFSISSLSHSADNGVSETTDEDPELLIRRADEKTLRLCLRDQFSTSTDSRTISYCAKEFEAGISEGKSFDQSVSGSTLVNELVDVMQRHFTSRAELTRESSPSKHGDEDTLVLFSVVNQLALATSLASNVCVLNRDSWCNLLRITKSCVFQVSELNALLELLRFHSSRAASASTTAEIADVLSARIGCDGIRSFGLASCQSAMAFTYSWVVTLDDREISLLLLSPRYLEGIFDILLLCVLEPEEHGVHLCRDAFGSLLAVVEIASPSNVQTVVQMMDRWTAQCPPSVSRSSTRAACNSAWQVLIQLMIQRGVSDEVGWKQTAFRLVRRLLEADAPFVADRLHIHNFLPYLCQQVFELDRTVVQNALDLLHVMCCSSLSVRRSLSSLARSGVTRSYQDGIMAPVRAVSWNQSVEPASDAYRAQRDQAGILDLLMRQAICAGLSPDEILQFSLMLKPSHFTAGERVDLSVTSSPTLVIVASGVIDWSLTVTRVNTTPKSIVYLERSRISKGGVIGARGLLKERSGGCFEVSEAAKAANDACCLIANDQLWRTSPLAEKIRLAVARATGGWHRWLKEDASSQNASLCYARQLVDLASGEVDSDHEVQDRAVDLLGQICSSVVPGRLENGDLDTRDVWFVSLIASIIQRKDVVAALRRDACRLMTDLAAQPSWRFPLVSLNRDSSRCDGLVVLGRAFRQCALDSDCIGYWFRVAVLVSSPQPTVSFAVSSSRSKVLIRAMADDDLVRLTGICLATPTIENTNSDHALLDPWAVLLLACHFQQRLRCLLKALDVSERLQLASRIVLMLTQSSQAESLSLRILAKATRSVEFCVALWSANQVPSESGDNTPDLLYLLKQKLKHATCEAVAIDCIIEITTNSLRAAATPDDVKQHIVGWMHQVIRVDLSPLGCLQAQPSILCASEKASLTMHVCSLVCAIDWCCTHLEASGSRVMARELRQRFAEMSWVFVIEKHFLIIIGDTSTTRSRTSTVLSAMRILYDSGEPSPRDDLEHYGRVLAVLQDGRNHVESNIVPRLQRDPVLLSAWRRVIPPQVDTLTGSAWVPRGMSSSRCFVEENHEALNLLRQSQSTQRELKRRLLFLREISGRKNPMGFGKQEDNRQDSKASESGFIVSWLMNLIDARDATAPVIRVAIGCLQNLLRSDGGIKQYVSANAEEMVLPQCFAALAESGRARVAKIRLLQLVCSLVAHNAEVDTSNNRQASEWMRGVVKVLLEHQHELGMTRSLVEIVRWLLSRFGEACFPSSEQSSVVERLIKYVQRSLISAPPDDIPDPANSITSTLDGFSIIAQILALQVVCVREVGVLSAFANAAVSWASYVSDLTESGNPRVAVHDSLLFGCLSAINQLTADERYAFQLNDLPKMQIENFMTCCLRVIAELPDHRSDFRKAALESVRLAFHALKGEQKRAAQTSLESTSRLQSGWISSLASEDVDEQRKATIVLGLMCERNHGILVLYATAQHPVLHQLVTNLQRCNEMLRGSAETSFSSQRSPVLQLHAHTSTILRRLVRALALGKQTISRSLLEVAETSLSRLAVSDRLFDDDVSDPTVHVESTKASIWLLMSCLKYHGGFCNRQLSGRWLTLLMVVTRSLLALTAHSNDLDRCADTIVRVARLPRPVSMTALKGSAREEFAELLFIVLPRLECCAGGDTRELPRAYRALHALTTVAQDLLGESTKDVIWTRKIPASVVLGLVHIFPRFILRVKAQVTAGCCALALELDCDHIVRQPLEPAVFHSVEGARRGFLNAVGGKFVEPVARARQVQNLSSLTKILCTGLSLWQMLTASSQISDAVGETELEGNVLWRSVLAGLAACAEATQTSLGGHIACEAANLMRDSHSTVSTFPGHVDVDDSVARLSDMLQVAPSWELAWLLTSFTRRMQSDGSNASLSGRLHSALPSLISAAKVQLDMNHIHGSFHLLGLIIEILRGLVLANDSESSENDLPGWGAQFYDFLQRALQVRCSAEFASLALLGWFLLLRLDEIARVTSGNTSETDGLLNRTTLYLEPLALRAANNVQHQLGQFYREPRADSVWLATILKKTTSGNRREIGTTTAKDLIVCMPALTLLDIPPEATRAVCVYFTLKIIEEVVLSDSSRDSVGRLFAEQTPLISDVSHLLDVGESLPTAYADIVLTLLAEAVKTFRLFATPVINEVKISSICRLIPSSELSLSIGAMHTLWQLLRNRRVCHRFVALVKSGTAVTGVESDDSAYLQRAIQHVKELVYTAELDERRLEAAYGILVQMSKAEESLDVVIIMDELHAEAIFMEDPDNLLAAVEPSTHQAVLLQQCKLLKHLSRWRPKAVLAKPAALQVLGEAIVTVEPVSSGSYAPWLLAIGTALVSLIESTGDMSATNFESLRLLLEDRQLAVLYGCYRALSWVVYALSEPDELTGSVRARLHRVLAIYATLFFTLTSSKRKLCFVSGIVSGVAELPRTILRALHVNGALQELSTDSSADRRPYVPFSHDQVHLQLLRTLRRLTVAATVLAQFRSHNPVDRKEPFDLLTELLHQRPLSASHSSGSVSPRIRELFLVILHVSRDQVVSTSIASRHDVLTSFFQFHSRHTPVAVLDLFWQVLHNVVSQAAHVGDILERLSCSENVELLAQHVTWSTEQTHSSLALAMTSTLRVITGKSSAHRHVLLFVPVFHALALGVAAVDPFILENLMVTLAMTAHACADDFELFAKVLALVERLVTLCAGDFGGMRASPLMRNGIVTQPLGLPTAVERLVCALCDLLLSFHEDEVNNSYFPGYEIKPVRNVSLGPPSPAPSSTSHERKRSVRSPGPITATSLYVRSKSNGVFSKGYSPTDTDILEQILQIFTLACTLPRTRAQAERLQLRSGRSIGGTSSASSILYVSDFFSHAAQTPSGRFFFLNPLVIQFWKRMLPRMDTHSMRKLCDGLVACTLSKDHVFKFLASGALRLLVTATCIIIRSAAVTRQRDGSLRKATKPKRVVDDAILQLVVAAAVLSERAPFLQSTYYLVHAGATDSISVAGFALAAIIYSPTRSPFLKLACKVLSRLLSLFTLEEGATFLASCPTQIARALGWGFVTEDDVVTALVTMLQQTEPEALMKHRVLVEVVHSTLLRTAILGLIDKGIPEVLHDYGLKTMMLHMEKLLSACDGLHSSSKATPLLPLESKPELESMGAQSEAAPRRRNSITGGGTKTSVEMLTAGLTAVGGAARNAGTLLATTFQDEESQVEASDPRSRFSRRLERCVEALRDVTNEIAEYTHTGYTTVFKSFELMNGDLELIAAMQSSSHAVALTQAAFYAMEILQEALTAALLDADEEEGAAQDSDRKTSESTAAIASTDHKTHSQASSESSAGSGGRSSPSVDASRVLETAEKLLGWITMSLQHSDMDVLFYGSKLMQLGSFADALIRLPLDEYVYEQDHKRSSHQGDESLLNDTAASGSNQTSYDHDSRRIRHQQSSVDSRRRIQRTENYPVFLRFRSLELRSWLWSVLGFLPYLRVRHSGNVQIIRFNKAAAAVESTEDSLQRLRDAMREYLCRFNVRGAQEDHIQTFYRDLPHTVDVEVWIYLPFWPRDVLVSRAKVPLLARTIGNDGYNFHLYPESARGVRATQAEIIGTLQMELSNQRSEATEASISAVDSEFPAYSTLGSRFVRRILRRVWSRIFAWTSDAVTTVAEVTQVNRLLEAATNANMRRKGLSVVATHDLSDSLERQEESVTMEESVAYLLTKILRLLRDLTHPDKLVAPGAVKESKLLVDQLEEMLPAFSQTLARAFKTKNTRVWRDAVQASDVVQGLFLTKGLAFFTTSFQHQQRHHSFDSDSVNLPGSKSPATRKPSQKEPRASLFFPAMTSDARVQRKPFRDIASQLRHAHLHHDSALRRIDDEHDLLRLSSQTTAGSRWLGRSTGHPSPSAKLLSSIKSRSSQLSEGRKEGDAPTLSVAAEYIHQYAASRSEVRMLSSHISIWSLSQARVPGWHSFDRAVGPTALNHFLLQPIERLQVYCILQQFLEQKLKTLQRHNPSTDPPATTGLPSAPPAASTRIRSASSMVSKFSLSPVKCNVQQKDELRMLSMPTKETVERGPSFSHAAEPKHSKALGALWKKTFTLSGHANRLAIVQKALNRAPDVADFEFLETIRARRLFKYHLMDPFDAASRLQRLYQDAKRLPTILYREGIVATVVHFSLWVLLAVTVWRVSIARDAMRDSERSFQELHSSQSSGDNEQIHEVLMSRSVAKRGSADASTRDHTPRIVISNRQESHDLIAASAQRVRRHQVAPSRTKDQDVAANNTAERDCIVLTQQELKHLVVLLELRSLVSDVFRVWPSENGNIGLNGFWSSLWFTATALISPFVFVYVIFPWVIRLNPGYTRYLSYVACAYGTAWILAALSSIREVTKKIPAFREVRRVEKINLSELPYCVRNYMAIGSVVWEGFQLNTTSFAVWKMSYKPKQLAALTTIDLQDIGLGSLQVNVFESKQTLALVALLVWFFCLKASNKFKSLQYLNYSLTFLLPNFLGGMMFMFLSKQFYQTAACIENTKNVTVMWANRDIACWTDPAHTTYALRGMFGMSIFVPLAVLAYGSYQVFFPEVNLDVQTSPLLNVSSQIVKAAMMGALTFFVEQVELYLAVALVGNLLLLFLVTKYDLCSTWHLKYGKVLIYAMSSWAAFCAMVSTFVRKEEDKDRVPLYIMHIGWGVLALLCVLQARRRLKKNQRAAASGREVLIKQQKPKASSWKRKPPSSVTPAGSEQEATATSIASQVPHVGQAREAGETPL